MALLSGTSLIGSESAFLRCFQPSDPFGLEQDSQWRSGKGVGTQKCFIIYMA